MKWGTADDLANNHWIDSKGYSPFHGFASETIPLALPADPGKEDCHSCSKHFRTEIAVLDLLDEGLR